MSRSSNFVLQGFDDVTKTVSAEWRVRIEDLEQLKAVLAPESDSDPDLDNLYAGLSNLKCRKSAHCACRRSSGCHSDGHRSTAPALSGTPYLIHTRFELPLMLDGRKPLAAFGMSIHPIGSTTFSRHSNLCGLRKILRRIIDTPVPALKQHHPGLEGMRDVLFALPDQAWRIDAMSKIS